MELRHLKYFVTAAEELNFRRAAERLYIAQPPLSRQIRQLEEELGVDLFHRTKRGVSLTEAGQAFLDEAQLTLVQAERAAQAAKRASGIPQRKLTIGFSICLFNRILSGIVQAFRQAFPEVSIALMEMSTSEQVQALVEGEIDVGLVRLPIAEETIVTETILIESLVLVLPADHALSSQAEISMQSLAIEQFVLFPSEANPELHSQIIRNCQQAGFQPNIVQEATPPEVVIRLVEAGAGISLVPASTQSRHHAGVIYRELTDSASQLEIAIAWHKQRTSPLVDQFLGVVRQAH